MGTKTQKNISFLCSECGDSFAKWSGQCPSCKEWNTLKEFHEPQSALGKRGTKGKNLTSFSRDHSPEKKENLRIETGIEEFDRVLGGGFFTGSVTLFGGSPGVGKSTLALQIFKKIGEKKNVFYFSGEESESQIESRLKRISQKTESHSLSTKIFSTNSLEDIVETLERNSPDFTIIDSIQMIGREGNAFGTITQIRDNAEILIRTAKKTNSSLLIIGHVTKDDEIAGPRVLEHLVDSVLYLEGEKNSGLRILRSHKNRFGSSLEVGVFEMKKEGLLELKNPSEYFLSERSENSFGSCITVMREGARNFLLEIQSLSVKTNFGLPRRTTNGIDINRLHLLLAVISRFTPFSCDTYDIYANVAGGLRIREPGTDLALIASILSSRMEKEIPAHTIILGEVGLSGEIRNVPHTTERLHEAEKLGFKKAIIPRLKEKIEIKNMELVQIKSVKELIKALF